MPNFYDKSRVYPTYKACREIVEAWTPDELHRRRRDYQQNANVLEGQPSKAAARQYHLDMVRAIDDEQLSRQYALDNGDDPFFEDEVREYQPGDLIDFGC